MVSVRLSENDEVSDFAGGELIACGIIRFLGGFRGLNAGAVEGLLGVEEASVEEDLLLDLCDFLWVFELWLLDEKVQPLGPMAGNLRLATHWTIALHILGAT